MNPSGRPEFIDDLIERKRERPNDMDDFDVRELRNLKVSSFA
jgi:hypothetical protein